MSKRNYNPWMAHVEVESDEPVSHVEIEFDEDDVADYMAYFCDLKDVHSISKDAIKAITPAIADAMAEFINSLPKDTRDEIADYMRDDDDFKQWLSERKDADLGRHKQAQDGI